MLQTVGTTKVVSVLLDSMQQLSVHDASPRITPLSYAARSGHAKIVQIVQILLARGKAELNAVDSDGRAALAYAAARGRVAMVELLLDMPDIQADVNKKSPCGMRPDVTSTRTPVTATSMVSQPKSKFNRPA